MKGGDHPPGSMLATLGACVCPSVLPTLAGWLVSESCRNSAAQGQECFQLKGFTSFMAA